MKTHQKIPEPITFNPHKHHFGFLLEQIKNWKKTNREDVKNEMCVIGTNLLDLYLGELTVQKICKECITWLKKENISEPKDLKKWLNPQEYGKIELSDHSVWLIKEGFDIKRFVHIHPAKNSLKSIRVKGTTLKTVLALKINNKTFSSDVFPDVKTVNQIRKEYLGLSPVKSLQKGKGILRLWNYFNLP